MKKANKALPNQRLKMERELRGWSQKYVAQQIGADHYYLSRWEHGTASPSPYYRQKLCTLFDKNARELGLLPEDTRQGGNTVSDGIQAHSHSQEMILDPAIPPLVVSGAGLVGRDEILQQLTHRLCTGNTLVLTALNGIPGVGKTTLALVLAHSQDVLAHFRDGVLWAGVGPQPNIMGALSRWGILLGATAAEAAKLTTTEAWTKTIHASIGMRQMLLVIDDVWQIEEALAFKVGGPNCAYLVTTRFPHVAHQFAVDGATLVQELNEQDSMTLLTHLAPEVVKSEPQAVVELLRLVGGLPLALTLIGKYLRTQAYSGQPRRIRAAIERLLDTEARLSLSSPQAMLERPPMFSRETPVSLQTILEVSDLQLEEQARYALRALSVFPSKPNSFSEEAALAVCAVPVEVLDTLNDAGLLESQGAGRYTLHQTIADYARLHLTDMAAYARMADYFADYAATYERDYTLLTLEMGNLFAALEIAFDFQRYPDLVQMTTTFARFLHARGFYARAETYLKRAERIARSSHDTAGLITTFLYLGLIGSKQGTYAQAEAYLQEGLTLARQLGDLERITDLLHGLGRAVSYHGDYRQSEVYLQEGVDLARRLNDPERISALLVTLAAVADELGHYGESETYLQEGLALARQLGDRERICDLLTNLGSTTLRQGNNAKAEAYMREGLEIARQIGYRGAVSLLLGNLGVMAYEAGDLIQGKVYTQESLEIAREIGDRGGVSIKLGNLAEIALIEADYAAAGTYLQEALELARQVDSQWLITVAVYLWGELHLQQQQFASATTAFDEVIALASEGLQEYVALSLYGLARIAAAQNDNEKARRLGQESLHIFELLGHRKVAEVRSWFEALPTLTKIDEQ